VKKQGKGLSGLRTTNGPKIYLYSDRELAGTLEPRVWTVVSPSVALAEIHTTAMSLAGLVKVGYSRRWRPPTPQSGNNIAIGFMSNGAPGRT